MNVEHEQLVDQYTKNKGKIEKYYLKTLGLEVVTFMIFAYMRSIQETASLQSNIVAACSVFCILFWHFWNFNSHLALHEKSIQIVLNGLKIERGNPFEGMSFFTDYIKAFRIFVEIFKMTIFDSIFVLFFCISWIPILKELNPETVSKIRLIIPIIVGLANVFFGWVYYETIKEVANLKFKRQ